MTKEQILDKHLKTLIENDKDAWFKFEEMKTMPEYKAVLNAMTELETELVKNNALLHDVVKSLPTDECVEQWWSEGQDQNKGFWQDAPYRTNGDVVEEIKTALKYFIETWQR